LDEPIKKLQCLSYLSLINKREGGTESMMELGLGHDEVVLRVVAEELVLYAT